MTNRINLPIDEIERRYKAGESAVRLGRKFGVGTTVITNRLRELGIYVRGANKHRGMTGGPATSMLREWTSTMVDPEFDEEREAT